VHRRQLVAVLCPTSSRAARAVAHDGTMLASLDLMTLDTLATKLPVLKTAHDILQYRSFDTLLTPNLSTFSSAVVPGTARIGRESDRDFPDVQI
jgi:hypothetical protein